MLAGWYGSITIAAARTGGAPLPEVGAEANLRPGQVVGRHGDVVLALTRNRKLPAVDPGRLTELLSIALNRLGSVTPAPAAEPP